VSPMAGAKSSVRMGIFLWAVLVPTLSPAWSGEVILPSRFFERDARVQALYRAQSPGTGKGQLIVTWTDVYDRLIEQRKIPFELRDTSDVPFGLDLRRAVAMRNTLTVQFSFAGIDKTGVKDRREDSAEISFIARPPDRTWWDYQIIMWQEHTAEQYATLKKLGISAGAAVYRGNTQTPPDYLLRNDLRWYAENIATDFYSAYHRLSPDRAKNWKFLEAKRLHSKDPSSKEAFKRDPSLSDPAWLTTIRDRLIATVRSNAPYRPLFYNLGDEPGIADLSAFWDFDLSYHSLTGMRAWLTERYGTLAALNEQWGTAFTSWDAVTPETTNEAMKRTDHNFSSWSDFKEWMDVSFARALKAGTDAVHSVDPAAYVAIEGAQQPGWGGYDYARLTKVLDAIEPYNIGGNVELIRSLNPKMVILTTAAAQGPWEKHRVWYELLHGSRGLILWDPKSEFVRPDGAIGPRGRDAEPYFKEIRGGIGGLVINSERQSDPIAVHYSQSSLRTEWMLEQKPRGDAWTKRSSSSDEDGPMRWLRESYCRLLEDLGRQYTFVTSEQIERGDLVRSGYRVLILPRSTALSEAEAHAMRAFVEQGGVLIADGSPGTYDARGRRLSKPHLSDFFGRPLTGFVTERSSGRGKAIYLNVDPVGYYRDRLVGKEKDLHNLMGRILDGSLGEPEFRLTDQSGNPVVGAEIHVFRNGRVSMVALQSNPQLSLPDLGPSDRVSNKRFEAPQTLVLTFPGDRFIYDLRAVKALGKQKRITVHLDPYEPTILSLSSAPMPMVAISGPRRLRLGETGTFALNLVGQSAAAMHVFHLGVVDPAGRVVPHYSGNILARQGRATALLPLAVNDKVGRWEIRVRDILSGQARVWTVDVSEGH
jgi:Beta-galactosidase